MSEETKALKVRVFAWNDRVSKDIDEEVALKSMQGLIQRQLVAYEKMASDFRYLEDIKPQVVHDDFNSYSVVGGFKFVSEQMDYWEKFWRDHFSLRVQQQIFELEEDNPITAKQALKNVLEFIVGDNG